MLCDNDHFNSLIILLLPPEIFEYFAIVNLNIERKRSSCSSGRESDKA